MECDIFAAPVNVNVLKCYWGSLGGGGVGGMSAPTVWPDARSFGDGSVGGMPTPTVWLDARSLGCIFVLLYGL